MYLLAVLSACGDGGAHLVNSYRQPGGGRYRDRDKHFFADQVHHRQGTLACSSLFVDVHNAMVVAITQALLVCFLLFGLFVMAFLISNDHTCLRLPYPGCR
jgi:hypothetical protein